MRTVTAAALMACGLLVACGTTAAAPTGVVVASATASPTPSATPTPDPTAAWPYDSSPTGVLAFRYDPAWHLAECAPGVHYSWGVAQGPATTIFIGSAASAPTECPIEDESPEIVIASTPIASVTPSATASSPSSGSSPSVAADPCGGSPVQTSVTVSAVTGTRQFITFPSTPTCNGIGAPGIHEVLYAFTTTERTYTVTYFYRQGDAHDLTAEVDLMVQHTLRFSAT